MVTAPQIERSLRERLDNWRLWMGIAYFGLALTVVALFFINNRTQHTAARAAALSVAHSEEIQANANAQYIQCVKSIPLTVHLNEFVHSVYIAQEALLQASERTLANTSKQSSFYPIRVRNVVQLRLATLAPSRIKFPVSTKAECEVIYKTELSRP